MVDLQRPFAEDATDGLRHDREPGGPAAVVLDHLERGPPLLVAREPGGWRSRRRVVVVVARDVVGGQQWRILRGLRTFISMAVPIEESRSPASCQIDTRTWGDFSTLTVEIWSSPFSSQPEDQWARRWLPA